MIKSMTAFARAENSEGEQSASVEVRSVNHRYCEVFVRLPRPYIALEEQVKSLVKGALARGRVEVTVEMDKKSAAQQEFQVDLDIAKAYHNALREIKDALGLERPVSLTQIARMDGVITQGRKDPDLDLEWPIIRAAVKEALSILVAMREKEGAALYEDFIARLDELSVCIDTIEELAVGLSELVRQRLEERIARLAGESVELDPVRVAQETAFLADKADITEEIVRARSHIGQFRQLLDSDDATGRSLNFLVQELHREFSTMGAKSVLADLSQIVVKAKAEVEKLREQIQNVE